MRRSIRRKRVVGIAGVDQIADRAQQLLHFLDRVADHTAWLTGAELAFKLNKGLIGRFR
jgi:hypothetical protein